jgi:glycosyltransferase involved in cell wall biosynthesis
VIAVSGYVKERVMRCFGTETEKIDVVYRGQDLDADIQGRQPTVPIPKKPFLFSAGSVVPYRGTEDLIRALALLRVSGRPPPLVVHAGLRMGGIALSYERWLLGLAERLKVADLITWIGKIDAPEMAWYFQHASAFVQTSRAEACPNIVLEAMAHAPLVVSCTQPPMPELLGDCAITYRTGDAADLAAGIALALDATDAQEAVWRERMRTRVAAFSWERTARQTLDVLERAAARE